MQCQETRRRELPCVCMYVCVHVHVCVCEGLMDGSSEEELFEWCLTGCTGVHMKSMDMGLPGRRNSLKKVTTG